MTDAGQFRSDAPWRHAFDAARDPYTARNALGITSLGGGGGAPRRCGIHHGGRRPDADQ